MNLRACICMLMLFFASTAMAQQNVVILLDDSGSMDQPLRSNNGLLKMDAAKSAIASVLKQLPDSANVGLAVLNGSGNQWVIPFGPLDKARVNESVGRIRASGGTPLGQMMKVAADELLRARSEQYYGTYKLLVITDGEANDAQVVEQYLPEILARGIVVDAIGVDMASDHSLATKTNSYRRADNQESLAKAITEVMAETTADSGDAGQSDFELLEGLSPDVASAALKALANPSNTPIGATAGSDFHQNQGSSHSGPTAIVNNQNNSGNEGGGGPLLFLLLIIIGVPLFILSRSGKQIRRR